MQSLETLVGVLCQSLGTQRAEAEASLRRWDAESPGTLFKSLVSLLGSGTVDDATGALALILARRAVDRLWRRGAPHECVALCAMLSLRACVHCYESTS